MDLSPFFRLVMSMKRQKSSPWEQSRSQMSHLFTEFQWFFRSPPQRSSRCSARLPPSFPPYPAAEHFEGSRELTCVEKTKVLGVCFAEPMSEIIQAFPAVGGSQSKQ